MIKVKVLVDDPAGRWVKGEEGILLEHCSAKYEYFVRFEGTVQTPFGPYSRDFFFYEKEVEKIEC